MTTTLTIEVTGTARTELSAAYNATCGRIGMASLPDPVRAALQAVGSALAGSEPSAEIDLSGCNRSQLSSVVRLIESIAAEVANPSTLASFIRDVEADDSTAHPDPDVPRLRDH